MRSLWGFQGLGSGLTAPRGWRRYASTVRRGEVFGETSAYPAIVEFTKASDCLDRVLRRVVVPGYSVVVQEREEPALVLDEPLLVALGQFGMIDTDGQIAEEAVHLGLVLVQVTPLQAVSVNRVNNAPEKFAELPCEGLELLVVGAAHQVVVHVPDEV
jgi:hypothetical protein